MTDHRPPARRRDAWGSALVAAGAGTLLWVLLWPTSGIDRNPPECYSAFGYVVPCDTAPALGVTLTAAAAGGTAAYALGRRGRA